MRKLVSALALAATLSVIGASAAEAGCYRWGMSGYHWYRFCVGPSFLYPHQRHCRGYGEHRYCWMS